MPSKLSFLELLFSKNIATEVIKQNWIANMHIFLLEWRAKQINMEDVCYGNIMTGLNFIKLDFM